MPTTTTVDFAASARNIGARTNSAAAAVDDLSAEEDRLINTILSEGALSDSAFFVAPDSGMVLKVGSGTAKADIFAVAGDVAGQGTYLVRLDAATIAVTVPAAEAADVRNDEIYLIVADIPYDAGTLALPRIGYRKGDAGGANPGPDAAWKASALLARVNVPAADTTIEATQITDLRAYAVLANGVPAGTMVQTARLTAPTGWLLCDGSAVSRSTFRRLFSAIGTNFGAGDGNTTFNVPNLKGRVPVGLDSAQTEFDVLSETGGAKTHTLSIAEMPAHDHPHSHAADTTTTSAGNFLRAGQNADANRPFTPDMVGGLTGGGGAHQNLQPYLVVHHLIKT